MTIRATRILASVFAFALAGCTAHNAAPPPPPAAVPAPQPAPMPANDYANPANWLCLPGVAGACDADEDTTVITARGKTRIERFVRAKDPKVDCFYVYPTVSRDPGVVSDMIPGPEEKDVVAQQFARFGAVCRTFAPMYRQFTLTALIARMSGQKLPDAGVDPKRGYNDVVDAWNYYLAHYNNARPFVLVGHSQGSGVLIQLIKNEIDGKPIAHQMLSAMLMGSRVQVPAGRDVGGDFQTTPLCHAKGELGCVIAYASFRANLPPPANSRFGKGNAPGLEAACVNPASPGGGEGPAHAYLGKGGIVNNMDFTTDWVHGKTIDTPFVSVPGLISAECRKNEVGSYLAIILHPDPRGARTNDIKGDVVIAGQVQADWGLHLIDANLFMGNLLDIVRAETRAYGKH
ncbi:MAG: DUF3089 domain-containing protein [Alphaproteobacteria bacterium]|nr:DUF3089 domain-containing protein [Alphaproteobacteria bacterium]